MGGARETTVQDSVPQSDAAPGWGWGPTRPEVTTPVIPTSMSQTTSTSVTLPRAGTRRPSTTAAVASGPGADARPTAGRLRSCGALPHRARPTPVLILILHSHDWHRECTATRANHRLTDGPHRKAREILPNPTLNGAAMEPPLTMVMSIARLSAGPGYRYLMRHTARGDAPDRAGEAMTRYYTNPGYPAGIWLGHGLDGLADGNGLKAGSIVTEEQMARLFGAAHDPVIDTVLGREYATSAPLAERIAAAVTALPDDLPDAVREAKIAAITATEKAKPNRASVAGFDLTFSVPKSVSVLWALSDASVQRAIVDAHHAAIGVTLGLIERDVARTRTGRNGTARVPVKGLIAAGFDHHDSRAGDPQLHSHLTVANRAQTVGDGRWRTLDSHSLYAAAVAHSDTYDLLLADNITRALGLAWETRLRGRNRNPRRELADIPDHLIAEFSQRSAAITAAKDHAIAGFVAEHRRQPTGPEAVRIRQQATLATRQPKKATSLAEYTQQWARRAGLILGADPRDWARHVTDAAAHHPRPATTSAIVDDATVEKLAAAALDEVEAKRSTWSRWNLVAAACRAMGAAGIHFTNADELLAARDRATRASMDRSVLLNPTATPEAPTVTDVTTGRSIYDPPEVFTSPEVLAAEDNLLQATDDMSAPTVPAATVERIVTTSLPDRDLTLQPDQAGAVRSVCSSGRVTDVLVGPAGTGKTTTMAGLRAVWEAEHGPGSVVGLATSAVAAQVLGTEIAVVAENTAQWLAQQKLQAGRADRIQQLQARRDRRAAPGRPTSGIDNAVARAVERYDRWALHPGQLLVLDEAGMADLHTLEALAAQAKESGAKLLLVGDHHQLPAIGAGGTFELLAEHRTDTPHLTGIHRFRSPDGTVREWEAAASLQLRNGNPAALVAYQQHGRFADGDTQQMIDAAYTAWKADRDAGLDSLLIAADNDTVQALNLRARADNIQQGSVLPKGAQLYDGTIAGIGDHIVTRRVDRHLPDGTEPRQRPDNRGRYQSGFVKNGAAFTVTAVQPDGALRVQSSTASRETMLPADYVAEHVELGYAVTAHRCQGMTVDTTHTIATSRMTREAFYVALTRGTAANHAYLTTDSAGSGDQAFGPEHSDRDSTLAAIIARTGSEPAARTLQARAVRSSHHRRLERAGQLGRNQRNPPRPQHPSTTIAEQSR